MNSEERTREKEIIIIILARILQEVDGKAMKKTKTYYFTYKLNKSSKRHFVKLKIAHSLLTLQALHHQKWYTIISD